MATISFSKKSKEPAPAGAPTPAGPAPAAPAGNNALAVVAQSPQIQGEFTSRDMAIPFLNLGQKSGTLCDKHPEWLGKFVFDKGICLESVRFVACRLRKYYEEDLEFGTDEIPQRFDTQAQALQAGLNPGDIRDVAELDLLVECDSEKMADFAMVELENKAYAPARFIVRSTAYRATVGILLKDLAAWLKNDLASGFYRLTSELKTGKGNSWYVPKLTTDGKVGPELRAVIREKFGV